MGVLPGQSQRSSTIERSSLLWMTHVSGLSSTAGGSLEQAIQPDSTEVPVQVSPALMKTRCSVSSATHALGSKPISVKTMSQPTTYGVSTGQRVTLQSPGSSSTLMVSGSEPVPPALRPPLPPVSLPPLAPAPPLPSVVLVPPLPPLPARPPVPVVVSLPPPEPPLLSPPLPAVVPPDDVMVSPLPPLPPEAAAPVVSEPLLVPLPFPVFEEPCVPPIPPLELDVSVEPLLVFLPLLLEFETESLLALSSNRSPWLSAEHATSRKRDPKVVARDHMSDELCHKRCQMH